MKIISAIMESKRIISLNMNITLIPDKIFPDSDIVSAVHPSALCGKDIVWPVSLTTLFLTIPSLIFVATPQTLNLDIAVAVANEGVLSPKLSILPKSIFLLLYSGTLFFFNDFKHSSQRKQTGEWVGFVCDNI